MSYKEIIVKVDEETWNSMDEFAHIGNTTMGNMLVELYRNFIKDPSDYLDYIKNKEETEKNLEEFLEKLDLYYNEIIYIVADKKNTEDLPILKVLEQIRDKHLLHVHIRADLYRTYLKHRDN